MHSVHPIVVCCLYILPNSCGEYFEYLTDLANGQDSVIVMGDFNLPDINWPTVTGSMAMSYAFCDLVFELNLTQLVCNLHTLMTTSLT